MNEIEKALTGFVPHVLPEVLLAGMACVLFLAATFKVSRHFAGAVALASLALAAVALLQSGGESISEAVLYSAPVVPGPLSQAIKWLALASGALLVLLGWDEAGDGHAAEYQACLLLITAGTSLCGCANDLVTLFLALELVSIPTYILLYLPRSTPQSQEAAMKYFLLSVFSSALLLFGFSYLYGVAGTTNIPGILDGLAEGRAMLAAKAPWRGLALVALVMVLAGLGFRITAVPFHFYAPDVYQGSSSPAAALLSLVPKIVGFAALFRVLGLVPAALGGNGGQAFGEQAPVLLWILAAVTMTLGNILALWQDNLRRLLAYSGVANAGYMLIGLAAAPRLAAAGPDAPALVGGVEAILFYLAAYGAMTVGAFAILHLLSAQGREAETVDDLAGLGRSHPGLALVLTLFLLSMIGIPLTAGFFGKLQLFSLAVSLAAGSSSALAQPDPQVAEQARLYGLLALIAAINAVIAAWYYLRVASAMYLREGIEPLPRVRPSPAWGAVALCAVVTVVLGVWPAPLQKALRGAVEPPARVAAP